jgi:predicted ATP-grasp superfamily ATP-dependent carboligase
LNALGVVRSLAPENVPITVISAAPAGPAVNSRFAKTCLHAPAYAGEAFLESLSAVPTNGERPVLFLTQEASVAFVSTHRDALQSKYRFLLAATDLLADLMDKRRFQERAAALGFDVPRTTFIERPGNVDVIGLTFPVIAKPTVKNENWERRYQKAYRFETPAELYQFLDRVEGEVPPLVVQEYIVGDDSDVYFTLVYRDEEGRTLASFSGRKLRQWPPQVGGTASCTGTPLHERELNDLTARFFDSVGFVGMGSMEYKHDRRSGRFVMVEPTVGRSDYQEEVATLNGVNIVRAAYRSLAGLPPLSEDRPKRMKVWRDAVSDVRSRLAQPYHRIPDDVANAPHVDALFRMSDPGPWLANIAARIGARLGRKRSNTAHGGQRLAI